MKKVISISCVFLCSSSLFSMREEFPNKQIQLFQGLKAQIAKSSEEKKNHFIGCFNDIVQENTVSCEINGCEEQPSLELKGEKKLYFASMPLKERLTDLYNTNASILKYPFEDEGLTLEIDVKENTKNIIISMYLQEELEENRRQESEQLKRALFHFRALMNIHKNDPRLFQRHENELRNIFESEDLESLSHFVDNL